MKTDTYRQKQEQSTIAMLQAYKDLVSEDYLQLFLHGNLPGESTLRTVPEEWIGEDCFNQERYGDRVYQVPRTKGLNLTVVQEDVPIGVAVLQFNEADVHAPVILANMQPVNDDGGRRSEPSTDWTKEIFTTIKEKVHGLDRSLVIRSAFTSPYSNRQVWGDKAVRPETLLRYYDTLVTRCVDLSPDLTLVVAGEGRIKEISEPQELKVVSEVLEQLQKPQINAGKRRLHRTQLLTLTDSMLPSYWVVSPSVV